MGSHTDPRGTGPECSKPPRSPAQEAVRSASETLTGGERFRAREVALFLGWAAIRGIADGDLWVRRL